MIWAIIVAMMVVGMVLLFAEVAIIPGFGVAGVSAILLLVGGVVTAWVELGPAWGMGALLTSGGLTLGVIVLAPRTRAGRSLVLDATITDQHAGLEWQGLQGKQGVALTSLRPAGAVEIDGRRIDVVTDGQFVDAGASVRVVSVEGARVVVAVEPARLPTPLAT